MGHNGCRETEAQRGVEESRVARVGNSLGKLDCKGNVNAGWQAGGVREWLHDSGGVCSGGSEQRKLSPQVPYPKITEKKKRASCSSTTRKK